MISAVKEITTISVAETEFEQMLRDKGFKTSCMKENVKAPSIQGSLRGDYVLPDIVAVDKNGRGWCFEVKSEKESHTSMKYLRLPGGYTGPVWYLAKYKMISYRDFSRAFYCPCVIVINGDQQWKAGFFTRIDIQGKIDYNRDIVVPNWDDNRGQPILFNVLSPIEKFFQNLEQSLVNSGWRVSF